ncbi:MAG: flagellar assembly peptidoglycan hydrolase FlgJ [Pseudomonas sp.]
MNIVRPGFSFGPIDQKPSPQRIDEVSRKLESQFTQMLVKCMRDAGDASGGDPLFPEQNQAYRDLYDRQLSDLLSQGKGLGLAPLIAKQLNGGKPLDAGKPGNGNGLVDPAPSQLRSQDAFYKRFPAGAATADALDAVAGRGDMTRGSRMATTADDVALIDSRACDEVQDVAETDPSAFPVGTPEHFVAKIWPHAQRAARELGVDPRALVAQAALETGWGRRGIRDRDGNSANNLFGIKATGWKGERVSTSTHEYVAGQRRTERADFRAYASPADSFADYVRLLKNSPRYQGALNAGDDVRRFASELQRAGYATDPAYARKIHAIANGPTLDRALASATATAPPMSGTLLASR